MSMFLRDAKDIDGLKAAIANCKGDVLLRSCDGTETFNMKSVISQYMAIGELCKDHGDTYEFFCMDKNDESQLIAFFQDLHASQE